MNRAVIYFGFNNPRGHKRGVENMIQLQAQAWGSGTRKYYVFFDTQNTVARWDDIVAIGIRYSPLQFLKVNLIVWRLMRRLRRQHVGVLLHSHQYLTSTFLWWKSDVFSVHDGLWYQKSMVGSRAPWVFFVLEKWVYWRSRYLQCNSEFTRKHSLLIKTGRPVRIVFCSTPLERLCTEGREAPLRLAENDETIIFSVRSIEERARVDLVLATAEVARRRGLRFVFLIAGKGPQLEHYRSRIATMGLENVRLLGYVEDRDLARLYAACDVVLMLCEYGEGFGIPAIEGYMFGKPVVASNRCAVPEVVYSREDLVENEVRAILSQLEKTLAAHPDPDELRAYYGSRFNNQIVIDQFREMYESVWAMRFGPEERRIASGG